MNIGSNRSLLGAVVILTIAIGLMITIATRDPEVSLKVADNFTEGIEKGTAFIEITATKHGEPFNGKINVFVKKFAIGGGDCDKTLSITVKDGKATFKMWGKNGKASWIEVRAGSDQVKFKVANKS